MKVPWAAICDDFHRDDAVSAGETASLRRPLCDLKPLINATTLDARSARFFPQLAGESQSVAAAASGVVIAVAMARAATTAMARPKRHVRDRVCTTGQLRSERAVREPEHRNRFFNKPGNGPWYPTARTFRPARDLH